MSKKMEKEYQKYKMKRSCRKKESVMNSKNTYMKKENGLDNIVRLETSS